jgi:regulator of replication initiation timing
MLRHLLGQLTRIWKTSIHRYDKKWTNTFMERFFQMYELNENKKKVRGFHICTIRTGEHTENDNELLQSRLISSDNFHIIDCLY